MTTISDIARAADVSVESVLRVLNREKVSSDVVSRVVAAMDAYGYGRLPRPETPSDRGASIPEPARDEARTGSGGRSVRGEVMESTRSDFETSDAVRRAREQLLSAVSEVVDELENPESRGRGSDVVGLRPVAERLRLIEASFDRLAHDLDGVKRELARARNERLEDLSLLVDLITTSWRAVDRRLGRIDRKLERMEASSESFGAATGRAISEKRGSPRF